jgi:hypothetical protein
MLSHMCCVAGFGAVAALGNPGRRDLKLHTTTRTDNFLLTTFPVRVFFPLHVGMSAHIRAILLDLKSSIERFFTAQANLNHVTP